MGSFNVSCAISHVSINPGDPIVFFPLKMKYKEGFIHSDARFLCEPCDIMTPMTFPIFGEYDDYGYIGSVVEDDNTRLIAKHYHMDMNKFYERETQLPKQTSGMFVHRSVYDYMISNHKNDYNGKETSPSYDYENRDELESQFDISMTNAKNEQKRDIAHGRSILVKIADETDEQAIANAIELAKIYLNRTPIYYINTHGDDFRMFCMHGFINIYTSAMINGKFKKEIIDMIYFYSNMYATNSIFFPTINGCQCGHRWVAKDIAELSLGLANKQIKEWKDNE